MAKSTGVPMNGTMLYLVKCKNCKYYVKPIRKNGKMIYRKCKAKKKTSFKRIICDRYERKENYAKCSPVKIGKYLPDGSIKYDGENNEKPVK